MLRVFCVQLVAADFSGGRATMLLSVMMCMTLLKITNVHVFCVQVVDVDFAGGRATIKLVPRLDLAAMAKDHMGGGTAVAFLLLYTAIDYYIHTACCCAMYTL
jgi:hypothetical protein